ncbi:hypothetical protein BGZ99_007425 [Dissophora globulifera]|uniref:separase n=1 Tax=Dissophora globulifera TaxID=979702 RepID=A0A9P6R9V4_9FUNG|nr:hypothetical protein BGZ99_007425 [Dissophora globulifera]
MFIYQKTVQQYGPLVSGFLDILQQYLNNTLVDLFQVVDNISILMRSYEQPLGSFAHHSAFIIQSIESRIGEVQALVSQHSQTIEDLSDIATEVATLVEEYEGKAYSHSSSSVRAILISLGLNLAAIPASAAAGGLATAVAPFSVVAGTICVVAGGGGLVSSLFSFYDRQKSKIYAEASIKLTIIQKCGEGFQAPIARICVKLKESKLYLQHLQTLTSNATTGYNTADSNTTHTHIYQEAYEAAQLEAVKINEMCTCGRTEMPPPRRHDATAVNATTIPVEADYPFAALDAVIDALADHRRYTAQLLPNLKHLLASSSSSSSLSSGAVATKSNASNMSGGEALDTHSSARLSKQVKRLVNQTLVMLNKWSEVLQTPNPSDVVAQESASLNAPSSTTTAMTATTAALGGPSISGTTTASAASRLLPPSGSSVARKTVVARGQVPALEETQAQKRVALMRGARTNNVSTTAAHIAGIARIDSGFSTTATTTASRATRTIPTGSRTESVESQKTQPALSLTVGTAAGKVANQNATYETDRPTYAHITVLVDVGFVAVRTLELMSRDTPAVQFEMEKARSNLISKVMQIGMKKRALQELGFLREQLVLCASSLWKDPDYQAKDEAERRRLKSTSGSSSKSRPTATDASVESIRKSYQHLFALPLPSALLQLTTDASLEGPELDQALTFVRLVQALHNNALRCWMDVRGGSLAYLLPEMMSQRDSPYDWCMCMAKLQQQAGQQSLDALFRLLFIGAGKAADNNPTREGRRHAFMLRMHGMRYYGALKHLTQAKDGMVWDKILRCGVDYEKSTRDGQQQEDILFLLRAYKSIFEFLDALEPVDLSDSRLQEWFKHLDFFVRKVDIAEWRSFSQRIKGNRQDLEMPEVTEETGSIAATSNILSGQRTLSIPASGTNPDPAVAATSISVSTFSDRLQKAVKALKRFEDLAQSWNSMSLLDTDLEGGTDRTIIDLRTLDETLSFTFADNLSAATLQNVARIFRSIDTLRSIGSKMLDKRERGWSSSSVSGVSTAGSVQKLERGFVDIKLIIQMLVDVTARLWHRTQAAYLKCRESDRNTLPDPVKLSCARVDAILLLFRLYQSDNNSITSLERPVLEYLESAFSVAKDMNDNESLPWISNALYNLGGALFKGGKRTEAIAPLDAAIECYHQWLGEDLLVDSSLENLDSAQSAESRNTKTEARLVLAHRYEVLGVCLQAVNDLDRALDCFNLGLCVLPLDAFRGLDTIKMGDLKTSQLPAAKLLNRRARILLMMESSRFISIISAVPDFEAKVTQSGVPLHFRGIVQEFECSLLSVLSVKTHQVSHRTRERIDILKHLMTKVYRGGRSLTNPVRRARVLVELAMLYQSDPEMDMQQEALHLVQEAIEILKERELRADVELESVRNHNLAMAYSWYGILDRNMSNGLSRKSKPFQIALQLWEMTLSDIECFVSCEDLRLLDHQAKVDKVLKQLPEPELLFDHLQMLADCLGMNDYRVLQVQIYLLMLRLCNGVRVATDDTCADTVRIYSRMAQAYLALGYSGKAKMALNHGKLILEEMTRTSNGSVLRGEVYATWLLVYSLYLTSVGNKAQSVNAYNQAKRQSENHQSLIGAGESNSSSLVKTGMLSRKIEAKVQQALILVEASLARSQLLYNEGNLAEAITDARRAGRQLSRIVSTLSLAIKTARQDPDIIVQEPLENPFIVQEQEEPASDRRLLPAQEQASAENQQLRKGLEMLAAQRYQWSIFRLLIEAYHQLGKLYMVQGSIREAQYFIKEGKVIAQLSRAGKSMDLFMLDEANLVLQKHEWEECQHILQDLIMQEDVSNIGALAWEVQDARIQLLNGDLHHATARWDLSIKAYYRTEEILSHLMDKSFISELEQLVIREPQTPREAKLVNFGQRARPGQWDGVENLQQDASMTFHGTGAVTDQAQFECVALGGMKAVLGYKTSLIFSQEGHRTKAHQLIERSKVEDPASFVVAEYHLSKGKVLISELEDAMAKHLMFAMIPDSALSVGLFRGTETHGLATPLSLFSRDLTLDNMSMDEFMRPDERSIFSSPSVRVTRMTRRRRSQLMHDVLSQTPSQRTGQGGDSTRALQQGAGRPPPVINNYLRILLEAREHLTAAYKHAVHTYSPAFISDICSKQAYLSVLESCFHQDGVQEGFLEDRTVRNHPGDRLSAMASRAACYLEMAKAVTQHREMHGLIKLKLNPESALEDQAWPKDIQIQDRPHSSVYQIQQQQQQRQQRISRTPAFQQESQVGEVRSSKTINLTGLEKPRRLRLTASADDDDEEEEEEEEEEEDGNQEDGKAKLVAVPGAAQEDDDDDDDMNDPQLQEVGMNAEDLRTKQGKREYFNRQSRLHASNTLGNERAFLEMLDKVYEQDIRTMEEHPETFQREFVDILPDKWTAVSLSMDVENEVLYVNRMRANATPLVVRLPLKRAQFRDSDDMDLQLQASLGLELGFEPEEVAIGQAFTFREATDELEAILKQSQETLSMTSSSQHQGGLGEFAPLIKPADLPREVKADWWARRQRLDDRLCSLLGNMEDQWLCGLRGLIQSHNTPANEDNLMRFKQTIEWIMSQAVNSMSTTAPAPEMRGRGPYNTGSQTSETKLQQLEINIELCRIMLHLGDSPSFGELKDVIYFLLDAYLYKNTNPGGAPLSAFGAESGLGGSSSSYSPTLGSGVSPPGPSVQGTTGSSPVIEYSGLQFGRIAIQIKEALRTYWLAETEAKNNGFDEGAHVILILDKHLQVFPWESCPVLRGEAVSRMPSMWLLRDRILQQRYLLAGSSSGSDRITNNKEWQDLEVDPEKTFYVLNPGADLKNTENEFRGYVKSQRGWEGVIGRAPMDLECIHGLSKSDLYVYFGHSGGEQYIRSAQIRQLGRCAVTFLLGCSSGSLQGAGEFDPTGNAMNYMLAGCPTLVANLWDVTDKDLDRFSMAMFKLWGLDENRRSRRAARKTVGVRKTTMMGGVDAMEGIEEDGRREEEEEEGRGRGRGDEEADEKDKTRKSGNGEEEEEERSRLSIVEAVKEAREECKLKFLVGAASVSNPIQPFMHALRIRVQRDWPRLVVALVSLYGIYFAATVIYSTRQHIYALDTFGYMTMPASPPPPPPLGDVKAMNLPIAYAPPAQMKFSPKTRSRAADGTNWSNSHDEMKNVDNNNDSRMDTTNNDNLPQGGPQPTTLTTTSRARPLSLGQILLSQTTPELPFDIDGHTEAAAIYTLLVISSLSIVDNAIGLMVATRRSLRLTQVAFAIWCLRFMFRIMALIAVLGMLAMGLDLPDSGPSRQSGYGKNDGYDSLAGSTISARTMMTVTTLEVVIAAVHGWSLLVLIRDLRNQPRPQTVLTRVLIWFSKTYMGRQLGLGSLATMLAASTEPMGAGIVVTHMTGGSGVGGLGSNSGDGYVVIGTNGRVSDLESSGSVWDREIAASLGLGNGLLSSASSIRSIATSISEIKVVVPSAGRSRASSISSFSSFSSEEKN